MCTYQTEHATVHGSAKGPAGWVSIDKASVYYDHPLHAQMDHSLNLDFVNSRDPSAGRVALELSPTSARSLVERITRTLDRAGL